MSDIVGIGIDLTQHVPLVSVATCPAAIRPNGSVDVDALVRHWPPKLEFRGDFRQQPPVALLPLMSGEPVLVGDAAARHRRSAGFAWPPEAQVPFADVSACGLARIPLVAVWAALLPHGSDDESMSQRKDHEFKWCPDGRERVARAGQILAESIKAFLSAAATPFNSCRTAIVVPDSLDEAGQQILLDNLAHVGLPAETVHLLPRPLAVGLRWCQNADSLALGVSASDHEEGTGVGRLRILTTPLDFWEAVSVELRARNHEGRVWLVPVRDRTRLAGALPELQTPGVALALALARAESNSEPLAWWSRMFATNWLAQRFSAGRDMSPAELESLRAVRSSNPPESLRREIAQLATLQPLWTRFVHSGTPLPEIIAKRWAQQEQQLQTSRLPCIAVLADDTIAGLRLDRGTTLAQLAGGSVQVFPSAHTAAASGAAVAAAAIANGLPCYRETLLPLDLYSMDRTPRGDPVEVWQHLVEARTVEAGKVWSKPEVVEGLAVPEDKPDMTLFLRRQIGPQMFHRKVKTALMKPLPEQEAVSIMVSVRPGQGFAKVRVSSKRPGLFTQLLDWRTMDKEDGKPPPVKLAYPPGVGIMEQESGRFYSAEHALRQVVDALVSGRANATEMLVAFREAHLGKYQYFDLRGHDQLYHGLVNSEGDFNRLKQPALFRELATQLGERFRRARAGTDVWDQLLRASGWLYLAIPEPCLAHVRRVTQEYVAGRGVEPEQTELHAIGLSFSKLDDMRLFYRAFLSRFNDTGERPNEWLRAIRNIVQFREHALSNDCASSDVAKRMVARITELLAAEADERNIGRRNVGQTFINCIRALPFLLKRRRYDPAFLKVAKDSVAKRLDSLLDRIRDPRGALFRRLPAIHREKPAATLRFLREEATIQDTIVVATAGR